MTSTKKRAVHDPQRLLKKLFMQFQKQVDELESRDSSDPERDTKSLAALAGTLARLSEMDEIMKKKQQDKKHAAKGIDRGTLLRELCSRLEKLTRTEGSEENHSRPRKRAQ